MRRMRGGVSFIRAIWRSRGLLMCIRPVAPGCGVALVLLRQERMVRGKEKVYGLERSFDGWYLGGEGGDRWVGVEMGCLFVMIFTLWDGSR